MCHSLYSYRTVYRMPPNVRSRTLLPHPRTPLYLQQLDDDMFLAWCKKKDDQKYRCVSRARMPRRACSQAFRARGSIQ